MESVAYRNQRMPHDGDPVVAVPFSGPFRLTDLAKEIANVLARAYRVHPERVFSRERTYEVVWVRQLTYYISRQDFFMPYTEIAKAFDRGFETVKHGCKRVEAEMETNPRRRAEVDYWRSEIVNRFSPAPL